LKSKLSKQYNSIDDNDNDLEKEYTINDLEEYIYIFVNSKSRDLSKKHDKYKIVFSQNPHDVAQMSTNRRWVSCKKLQGTGGQEEGVYCEVESGGFIAYIVRDDDLDIKDPICRLLIRRYVSEDGLHSIAVPENIVYGINMPGFKQQVNDWINSHQKQIIPGDYKLEGDEYTDTLPTSYLYEDDSDLDISDITLKGKNISGLLYKFKYPQDDFDEEAVYSDIYRRKKDVYDILVKKLEMLDYENVRELYRYMISNNMYRGEYGYKEVIPFAPYMTLDDLKEITIYLNDEVFNNLPDKLKNEYSTYLNEKIMNDNYNSSVIISVLEQTSITDEVFDKIINLPVNNVMYIFNSNNVIKNLNDNQMHKLIDYYSDNFDGKIYKSIFEILDRISVSNDKIKKIIDKGYMYYKSINVNKDNRSYVNFLRTQLINLKDYL
jgi:hypothetical protein